jgi:HAE1 family hydrophobic/amphiphilic exporter-1
MASQYNLTADGIVSQLKDRLTGKLAGKFEDAGELNDITVRLPEMSSEFYYYS